MLYSATRAMTRFQIVAISSALVAALALAIHKSNLLIAAVGLFLLSIALGVAIPQLRLFGPLLCRANPTHPWVALTFDDGPDARSTPMLLDVLKQSGVEVAFFCVGARVEANPSLTARIASEGHLVENHSYTHSNTLNFLTVGKLRAELSRTQHAIEQATGVAPRYFRPPMGLSNPNVFRAARSLGLAMVGWSNRGLDTMRSDPKKIVARILNRLRPGAIILLHDGNIPAERLVTTVRLLLDSLRRLDYEVVRLDRLLVEAKELTEAVHK